MTVVTLVDESMSSRDLIRTLRVSASRCGEYMPESVAWHAYLELERRGHDGAGELFVASLRSLHARRSMSGSDLSTDDKLIEEHRLTNDQLLSELWKAYKKCIRNNRTGPAHQLIRDIEERINEN